MTTLADILRHLRTYDQEPYAWQEPTIYPAEPWSASAQAIVTWSMPKGGLPDDAAKLGLVRVIEVRGAIKLLADQFDQLVKEDRMDELCALLVVRVHRRSANGGPYIY